MFPEAHDWVLKHMALMCVWHTVDTQRDKDQQEDSEFSPQWLETQWRDHEDLGLDDPAENTEEEYTSLKKKTIGDTRPHAIDPPTPIPRPRFPASSRIIIIVTVCSALHWFCQPSFMKTEGILPSQCVHGI